HGARGDASSSAAFLKLPCRAAASNTRTELNGGSLNTILRPPREGPQVTAAINKDQETCAGAAFAVADASILSPPPVNAVQRPSRFSRLSKRTGQTMFKANSDMV